jgi:Kef-type K+ transport system membrane component KefB
MGFEHIVYELALIFVGASLLSTLFLYLKQPIILAYIALGMMIGPWGVKLIKEPSHIESISHIGIILLLFLLGLNLHPNRLLGLLRKTSIITFTTSVAFAVPVALIALAFRLPAVDSIIAGAALMFSSTVVSIKLTPTTALHHKRMGEMMTSVLLLQDIIAIVLILLITSGGKGNIYTGTVLLILKTVLLGAGAGILVKYCLLPLFGRFDVIQDYMFLVSLGWCLLVAAGAKMLGISYEAGAFIAGTSLASFPIAIGIAEKLKPLREFFLILFFFAIGAKFDLLVTKAVLAPALVIALVMIVIKPLVFAGAFRMAKEERNIAGELGVRMGQASEFALLVAYAAAGAGQISRSTSYLIQLVVILTFIISTYIVVLKYPTPISTDPRMRRD